MTQPPAALERLLCHLAWAALAATAGAAQAEVQILQISDSSIAHTSTQITDAGGFTGLGATDQFCVVNTAGGGVTVQVLSAGGAAGDGMSFFARGGGGATIRYRLSLFYNDNTYGLLVSQTGQNVFTLPAVRTAVSTTACGLGNIKKVSVLADPLTPGTGSFSDTITFVVGPQ
jgi:hypothetical protein